MAGPLLAVGTGIQVFSALQAGEQKEAAYEKEAAAKRSQAVQVQLASARESDIAERNAIKLRGAQIGAIGQSGVTLEGSPLLQIEESAKNAYSEIAAIKSGANYKSDVLNMEANNSDVLGGQARTAGYLGAAGSILTGISRNPYVYDTKVGGNL